MKTINILLLGFIIVSVCTSGIENPNLKSNFCDIRIVQRNLGSTTIQSVVSDVDEDLGPYTLAPFDSQPDPIQSSVGSTIIGCITVPGTHPAGRLKVTSLSGTLICIDIPANYNSPVCYTIYPTVCGETYIFEYKEVHCPN